MGIAPSPALKSGISGPFMPHLTRRTVSFAVFNRLGSRLPGEDNLQQALPVAAASVAVVVHQTAVARP